MWCKVAATPSATNLGHPVKSIACALFGLILLAAMGIAVARSLPEVRPAAKETPLYIIENPGKDGVIWSVGFGGDSAKDFNRRVRVRDQAEAEKLIALLQETAPRRYRFVAFIVI